MRQRPADSPSPLQAGTEPIPGYRLIRRRGRGGFGEVWQAEASGGIHVALKFVNASARAQAAELRALSFVRGIHHPNILANFGAWQVEGVLVVGMELADGSLWDRYIEVADQGLGGIPRSELLGYMAETAGGLDYLNEPRHSVDGRSGLGIQHRDIKPPNLLLFGGGVKLADLGMARTLEGGDAEHTGTWSFPYAAPEFFRGRTSRQSDQYGLAATYCQLRCGQLPFEGGPASVTAGHLYGVPDLNALPEAERPVLERALAKEPGDRWPDSRAFVEALRAIAPDLAPEVLPRLDEPIGSISGIVTSSTKTGGDSAAGPPDRDWRDFESMTGLDSLMDTADTSTRSPSATPSTALLPDERPWPWDSAIPTRRTVPRGRIGRKAATVLVVGLAIAVAGVRPSLDHPQAAPANPSPRQLVASTIPAGPVPEAPAPEARPEVEPGPAPDVNDVGPSGPTEAPVAIPEGPTIRSDLVPRRRSRPPIELAGGKARPLVVPGAETTPKPTEAVADSPAEDPARAAQDEAARAEILGRRHFANNAPDRAIAEFDRAIRLRPGLASTYFFRALAVALRMAATSAAAASLITFFCASSSWMLFGFDRAMRFSIQSRSCWRKRSLATNARYLVCFTNYAHLRWSEATTAATSRTKNNRKGSLAWPSFTW